MRVLITGVSGFIGSHLARRLVAEGHEVLGIARTNTLQVVGVHTVYGDVSNPEVFSAIGDVDAIVHLAARTSHDDIVHHALETLESNWWGTRNALGHIGNGGMFIYASTGKVYGDAEALPLKEDSACRPKNILGKSKYISERLVDFYATVHPGSRYRIARIFNVYGPSQRESFLIPTIVAQLKTGTTTVRLGDIHARRDYVHVDDVVSAFVQLLGDGDVSGISYCNVASGEAVSAEDIIRLISEIMGKAISVEGDTKRHRPDENDIEYGSVALLEKMGWEARFSLKEGLAALLKSEGVV